MIFISMLRGINVSGQKKILMTELKALYESLGFKNVVTYIQSGNVIFSVNNKTSEQALIKKIQKAIKDKYDFDVPVVVRTLEEMKQTITANPFIKRKGIDTKALYTTFLEEEPDPLDLAAINKISYPEDEFIIKGKDVFLYCPGGYGETKLSNNFFEKKLKLGATTRKWNTVNKLVELAT